LDQWLNVWQTIRSHVPKDGYLHRSDNRRVVLLSAVCKHINRSQLQSRSPRVGTTRDVHYGRSVVWSCTALTYAIWIHMHLSNFYHT